jgi:DNA-binding transcriptional regulator YbjK
MRAAERRVALVRAALEIIATEGVAAATTRAIVARAGMSLASFHYVFASRHALIAECIHFVIENEVEAAAAALEPVDDLHTSIRDGLRGYLGLVVNDPHRELAMFELAHYAMRTPGLAGMARTQYESYYHAAATLLDKVAAQHGIVWRHPAQEMARILITLTDGITLGYLVDRDRAASERVVEFAATALAALARPAVLPAATFNPAITPPSQAAASDAGTRPAKEAR